MQLIPSFLVPAVFVLTAVVLLPLTGGRRRAAMLWAALIFGIWTELGTEGLSAVHELARGPLAVWWGLAIAVLMVIAVRRGRAGWRWARAGERPPRLEEAPFGLIDGLLVGLIVLVMGIVTIAAAVAPPNNLDSLDYHLPRQVRWMQDRTVAQFPTNDPRLNHMPPLAEFVGVNLMILSGGSDRWSNLVQTAGAAICLIAISLIVEELGGSRRAQLVAALLALTYPSFFFQASSPKNDVAVAAWLLIMLWLAVRVLKSRQIGLIDAAGIGAALGLALLTKGTAFVYGLPLCAMVAAGVFRVRPVGRAVAIATIAPLLALAINAPHFYRNWRTYHYPTGPNELGQYNMRMFDNQIHTPGVLVSNLLRNSTLHLGLPSATYNAWLQRTVEHVHEGLGVTPSDERTTYLSGKYSVIYMPQFEDEAGGFVQFIVLVLLPLGAMGAGRRLRGSWLFWAAVALPWVCFGLFCWMLSWQVWHTRLHIAIFCFAAIPAGMILTAGVTRFALPAVVAGALAALAPCVVEGPRSLFGQHSVFNTPRRELMCDQFPWIRAALFRAIDYMARPGIRIVGLHLDHAQYAVERLLMDRHGGWVFVNPLPRQLPPRAPHDPPADVILTDLSMVPMLEPSYIGQTYLLRARFAPYSLYVRKDIAERLPVDLPTLAWTGIDPVAGLGKAEPPDPATGLPAFRPTLGMKTEFRFYGLEEQPLRLVIRGRAGGSQGVIVHGRISGRPLFDYSFPAEGREGEFACQIVPTKRGIDTIAFAYERAGSNAARPAETPAVLFFDIRLMPDRSEYGGATTRPAR